MSGQHLVRVRRSVWTGGKGVLAAPVLTLHPPMGGISIMGHFSTQKHLLLAMTAFATKMAPFPARKIANAIEMVATAIDLVPTAAAAAAAQPRQARDGRRARARAVQAQRAAAGAHPGGSNNTPVATLERKPRQLFALTEQLSVIVIWSGLLFVRRVPWKLRPLCPLTSPPPLR